MAHEHERDALSGVETTGHEWDGISELNTPLPRWWLWTFYATILWAIGYWIAMPAWPLISGYTQGLLGHSERARVAEEMAAAEAEQAGFRRRIAELDLQTIRQDAALLGFAVAGGRSAFAVNCSQCHGSGAAGARGYPNLNDDEWLWGGRLEDIHETLRFGIRSGHAETRLNDMPAFLTDGLLTPAQVADVAEYVLSLGNRAADKVAAARGQKVFAEQCVACHKEGGVGSREFGAPSLADGIWLYGGERKDIVASISTSRRGVMPAWEGRLAAVTLKELAIYVHSLGGGE